MSTGMACQHCGVPVSAGAKFCMNCGADVSSEQGNVATRKFTSTQAMHDQLLARVRHAALGEHEILTELGRGGMATVYLAHDIQLDRKVAIKVMLPALLEGDDMVERFRLEARTAAALSHPHIIPIFNVRTADGLVYFVMKFVEGRPLDAIIKELGQLPVPMVRSILSKVGEALGYAHRRGVVHRDIKPANLMIDIEGQPVVTDFGIAKVADAHGLTMTGAMMGTPTYMSPEQCSAGEISGSSDQYSLGIVAYQMLGGRVPFEGETLVGLLYKHCHDAPAPLLEARPDCPPQLAAAVMRMLEKDPANRFPTMEAAVEAIGAVTLAYDDPIRTQLVGLAKRGENVSLLKRISTPSSPVPMRASRVRPSARATAALPPDSPTTPIGAPAGVSARESAARRRPVGAYAGVAALLVALAVTAWLNPWAAPSDSITSDTSSVSPAPLAGAGDPGSPPVALVPPDPAPATGTETPANASAAKGEAPAADAVASLRIAQARATLTVGESMTLRATALSARGEALTGRAVRWTSSDASRATITPDGVVTARAPGDVMLTARSGAAVQSVPLRLDAVRAASIALSAPPALEPGGTARLTATVLDAGGRAMQESVAWRTSDAGVARVQDGLITAVSAGSAVITATADGRDASVTVRVNAAAAPEPVQTAPPVAPSNVPAADPRVEIEGLVQRYARALERKQLSEVRAAYPGLTAEQEATFTQTLRTLQQLKVSLTVGPLNVVGDDATAAVSGSYEFYSPENRRTELLPVRLNITLDRGASGWQIRSITSAR